MGKVMYAMSVSLDGFIEGEGGDLGWSVVDGELHQHFLERERTFDLLLYGRRLYELMAAHWPTADQDPSASQFTIDYARTWREKKKIVFSKTLAEVSWNARLFQGDLAEEINRLKSQIPGLMVVGGATLAASFMRLGLIDEYRLYVHPVILGSGKPMFPRLKDRINLELVETHTFGSGVVLLKLAARPAPEVS